MEALTGVRTLADARLGVSVLKGPALVAGELAHNPLTGLLDLLRAGALLLAHLGALLHMARVLVALEGRLGHLALELLVRHLNEGLLAVRLRHGGGLELALTLVQLFPAVQELGAHERVGRTAAHTHLVRVRRGRVKLGKLLAQVLRALPEQSGRDHSVAGKWGGQPRRNYVARTFEGLWPFNFTLEIEWIREIYFSCSACSAIGSL